MVVTVHDVDFLDNPERLSRRGRSFFPRAWRRALDRADRIVCSSADTAAAVDRHGAPSALVRTVPLGVSQELAPADDVAAVRERFGLPETFVLWVGTVEPRKNLGALVAAMQPLDLPLAVVGPEGWTIDEQDLLAPLGRRVHRLGTVSQADLRALYAAATVFVLPSLAEGFGLPVLEAMVQGTAVITSAGTATEETAGGAARLIDPTDPASIRAAIVEVCGDEALRADLERRSSERGAECSWEATAAGYADVFAELLD
jgi:glycosyltransferase involved in cell wall biosynthesis